MAYFVTVWYSDRKLLEKNVMKTEKPTIFFFFLLCNPTDTERKVKRNSRQAKEMLKTIDNDRKGCVYVCLILIHCAPTLTHTPNFKMNTNRAVLFGCLRETSNSISSHHFRMWWIKHHKPNCIYWILDVCIRKKKRTVATPVKTIVFHRTGNGAI